MTSLTTSARRMEILMDRIKLAVISFLILMVMSPASAQDKPVEVLVNWDKVTRGSQTTPTLQVVVNPPLRRGTPIHDNAFKSLHDLQADYVRYVPWLPYPKRLDRKSTRLNSSHSQISYAVFCLKKQKTTHSHVYPHYRI